MEATPSREFEIKILKDMIGQIENRERTLREQERLRKVLYTTGYSLLLISFLLAINSILHPFIAAVIAFFAGCAIGFAVLLKTVQKQWPIAIRHANVDSMKSRLGELEN